MEGKLTYELGYEQKTFIRCLDCGLKDFNPDDIKNLWCPWCRKHHEAPVVS